MPLESPNIMSSAAIPYYKWYSRFMPALTRLRQNITNQAHYRGMSNAWQNYQLAMQDLRQYYQEHYWQSGGTPHNFHGHDNR